MKTLKLHITACIMAMILFGCTANPESDYFVFLNINPAKEELPEARIQELQEEHLANMDRLSDKGDLIASGPFEGGGGMMILKAGSEEEAREMLNSDPAVQAERFRVEILPISFIKGSICTWDKPVEMATYGFYRFGQGPNKSEELIRDHFYQLSVLEDDPAVLVQADFDDSGSGILILNEPLSDEWTERIVDNQAIQEGAISLEIKNLWIARGTFCN